MNEKPKVRWLLQNFPKAAIAAALVISRERRKIDREESFRQNEEMREMKEALAILPEVSSHKDVMNHIYALVGEEYIEIPEIPEIPEGPQTGTL